MAVAVTQTLPSHSFQRCHVDRLAAAARWTPASTVALPGDNAALAAGRRSQSADPALTAARTCTATDHSSCCPQRRRRTPPSPT